MVIIGQCSPKSTCGSKNIVVQGAAAAEQEEKEGQEKVIDEEEKENNEDEDVNEEMQISRMQKNQDK